MNRRVAVSAQKFMPVWDACETAEFEDHIFMASFHEGFDIFSAHCVEELDKQLNIGMLNAIHVAILVQSLPLKIELYWASAIY